MLTLSFISNYVITCVVITPESQYFVYVKILKRYRALTGFKYLWNIIIVFCWHFGFETISVLCDSKILRRANENVLMLKILSENTGYHHYQKKTTTFLIKFFRRMCKSNLFANKKTHEVRLFNFSLFLCSACFGAFWKEWNCMDYEPLDDDHHKDDEDNHHDITTIIWTFLCL